MRFCQGARRWCAECVGSRPWAQEGLASVGGLGGGRGCSLNEMPRPCDCQTHKAGVCEAGGRGRGPRWAAVCTCPVPCDSPAPRLLMEGEPRGRPGAASEPHPEAPGSRGQGPGMLALHQRPHMWPSALCVTGHTRTRPGQPREAQRSGRHRKLLPDEVRGPGNAAWGPGQPQMAPAAPHSPRDGWKLELPLRGTEASRGGAGWGRCPCRPDLAHHPPCPFPGPGQGPSSRNAGRRPRGQGGAREPSGVSGEGQAPSCPRPAAKQPEGVTNRVQAC